MNLAYWGFYRWPFDRRRSGSGPDCGTTHEEALARLLFLVEQRRQCGMVTGPAGIGKTCLLRRIKSHATRLGRTCVEIDATGIEGNELAQQFADQVLATSESLSSPARVWSRIHERLAALVLVRQTVVVLIDHFDLVEFGCSQAIRRLMHLADISGINLTILIAARERFTAPLLLDAVELSMELLPWTFDETSRFIAGSLREAGAKREIFSADAVAAIHSLTQGIPSQVVWLCDLCLLAAMSHDEHHVNQDLVQSAATELTPREWMPTDRKLPFAHVR